VLGGRGSGVRARARAGIRARAGGLLRAAHLERGRLRRGGLLLRAQAPCRLCCGQRVALRIRPHRRHLIECRRVGHLLLLGRLLLRRRLLRRPRRLHAAVLVLLHLRLDAAEQLEGLAAAERGDDPRLARVDHEGEHTPRLAPQRTEPHGLRVGEQGVGHARLAAQLAVGVGGHARHRRDPRTERCEVGLPVEGGEGGAPPLAQQRVHRREQHQHALLARERLERAEAARHAIELRQPPGRKR